MKGKYITTNIILACLASATAARRLTADKQRLRVSEFKEQVANKVGVKMFSQEAA